MPNRIAIIPARSGSIRIKDKNIKKFHGKPLILYSLSEIKKSKMFDKIHVSTDSKKIANIVNKININTDFLRTKKLSQDKVSIQEIIKFVLEKYSRIGLNFDEVWLFFATNPFVNTKIIKKAYDIYLKNKKKFSIITVTKYNYPIEWSGIIKNKKIIPLFPKLITKDSKKTYKAFCDAGMLVIYQKSFLKNRNKNIEFIPCILPLGNSVDIDDQDDFRLAEKLFKNS